MRNTRSVITWLWLGILIAAAAALAACVPVSAPTPAGPAAEPAQAGMANPASQNCVDQGGTLTIEARGDGGEFGVCTFEDNRQCEEWALFHGECPVGGVKVTGYTTPAARYCAISGGSYSVTANSGANDEQGTCTLPGGAECDAAAYYDGTCDASSATTPGDAPATDDAASADITATQVITYAPEPPSGEPQAGNCWTNSISVWRADAWRCMVGNMIYDPCFSTDAGVICGANPMSPTATFALTLTEPLPAPDAPQDMGASAWMVKLADGAVCEFATGATGGVGDERINYFCPSPTPGESVVILGDLQPGQVWTAHRAVITGNMPDLQVLESSMEPIATVWR